MGQRGKTKQRRRRRGNRRGDPILLYLGQESEKPAPEPAARATVHGEAAPEPEPEEQAVMVKKSRFLEKLFGSRRARADAPTGAVQGAPSGRRGSAPAEAEPASAEDVRHALETAAARAIDDEATPRKKKNGNGSRAGAKARVEPDVDSDAKDPDGKSAGLTRVLGGRREEALQALTDGFKDLSQLLQGVNTRMEEQSQRSEELNDKFTDLPAMAKSQVDFLAKLTQQFADQKHKTNELLSKLGGLPDLLQGIHKTLERQTSVEERTEKNLRDFRSTMDRIHSSIGQLTTESQKAVKEATDSFERSHSRTTRVFEETQKQAYETFEKTQSAQLQQLTNLVERSGKLNRGVVVLLILVFASLVALFGIVLGQ